MSLNAEYYRNNSTFQTRSAKEILQKLALQGMESILDIGCGDGRITAELAKLSPNGNVVGIDSSTPMINLAQKSFSQDLNPNLAFLNIAAEEMSIGKYDIALILNTLHWIRDPFKAFENIFKSLKNHGQLYILTYPKESPYWEFLDVTVKEQKWNSFCNLSASHTMLYSDEYLKLLKKSGFEIAESSLEENLALYESEAELMAYLRGWISCYLPLPKRFEDSFLENAAYHATRFYFNNSTQQIEIPFLKQIIHCMRKG